VQRAKSHTRHNDNYRRRRSTEERFEKVEAKCTQTGAKCAVGVNVGSYESTSSARGDHFFEPGNKADSRVTSGAQVDRSANFTRKSGNRA
jgi:4-hydroxy-3-methylbut-2-en-1-yl diphosphate synthase IspG/GcpE